MCRHTLTLFLLLSVIGAQAQYNVTVDIKTLPGTHKRFDDTLYVAGSFNGWNPKDRAAALVRSGTVGYTGRVKFPSGKSEFKITRGSWQGAESDEKGGATANRVVEVSSDTLIQVSIRGWSDHFVQAPKQSTASKNVQIISTSFYMPQLDRSRRVWVYLPQDYTSSRKRYPVLYMQDGQNVFEDTSSFSGEWGVDEALDSAGGGIGDVIVVAVDHGGAKRLNEYAPFDMERYGKGEGAAYAAFLTNTLRPYINSNFRTKRGAKHQYIAGSSMGGLISFYTTWLYPNKWGAAGVFSPSFWIAPGLQKEVETSKRRMKSRLYFYAGKEESEGMVPDLLSVFNALRKQRGPRMKTVIRSAGAHNEGTWRQEFPLFLRWLQGR